MRFFNFLILFFFISLFLNSIKAKEVEFGPKDDYTISSFSSVSASSTPLVTHSTTGLVTHHSDISMASGSEVIFQEHAVNGTDAVTFGFSSSVGSSFSETFHASDCAAGEIRKKGASGLWYCATDSTGAGSSVTFYNATSNFTIASTPAIVSASMNPVNGDITVTFPTAVGADGDTIKVSVANNSATYTATMLPNGSETLGSSTSTALVLKDSSVEYVSDGTNWRHVRSIGRVACILDKKATGSNGGTCTSGTWRTRDLNNIDGDPSVVKSLAANQFLLHVGNYRWNVEAPAGAGNSHQAKIESMTNGGVAFYATGRTSDNGTATDTIMTASVTRASTSTELFELQQECQTTSAVGFGSGSAGVSTDSPDEIYSRICIEKIGD